MPDLPKLPDLPDLPDEREELLRLGAATLGESGGHAMRPRIRAAWHGATVCGPAWCARNDPGDNLAIHVAAATAPAGAVIVASVGDVIEIGYWGEVLTTAAEARGVVGLVIDGGVRDVDALRGHGFGAFAATIALRGATKERPGEVAGTVTVGDVDVYTGDWIVGDADGVVVIRAGELDDVLAAGRARAAKEAAMFEALRGGATTLDLLGLDPTKIAF
jgi:4-hydroxy-4-methyl-2-oxoglutarate aldolase